MKQKRKPQINNSTHLDQGLFLKSVRSYLGTPYRHQGRTPGERLDCLGVVICALQEQGWQPGENSQAGTLNYDMRAADDLLERTLKVEGREIELNAARPTDILLFHWPGQEFAQHCGVIARSIRGETGNPTTYFIHAYNSRTVLTVTEQALRDEWRKLVVGVYRLNCFSD